MITWNVLLMVNRSSQELGDAIDERMHAVESAIGGSTSAHFRPVEVFVQEARSTDDGYDVYRRRLGNDPAPPAHLEGLGRSEYISGFLSWSREQRKANHEILWVLSHGTDGQLTLTNPDRFKELELWFGPQIVDTNDQDDTSLSPTEFREAIPANDGPTLILLESCVQGSVETAYALRDRGELLVVSESWFDALGPPHQQWLEYVVQHTSATPADVGRMMIAALGQGALQSSVHGTNGSESGGHACALLQLDKMERVAAAVQELVNVVESNHDLRTTFERIVKAHILPLSNVRCDFLGLMSRLADVHGLAMLATRVRTESFDLFVSTYSCDQDLLQGRHGLSILGRWDPSGRVPGKEGADFYEDTGWYRIIPKLKTNE